MSSTPQFSATVFSRTPSEVARFYVDAFGLEVGTDVGWFVTVGRPDGPWEVCVWDPDHESVPATARTSADSGIGPLLAFVVDDADTVVELAREAGAEVTDVIDEPWGQRHAFVRDPAGTVIDVVQVTTPDPAWLAANGMG